MLKAIGQLFADRYLAVVRQQLEPSSGWKGPGVMVSGITGYELHLLAQTLRLRDPEVVLPNAFFPDADFSVRVVAFLWEVFDFGRCLPPVPFVMGNLAFSEQLSCPVVEESQGVT